MSKWIKSKLNDKTVYILRDAVDVFCPDGNGKACCLLRGANEDLYLDEPFESFKAMMLAEEEP